MGLAGRVGLELGGRVVGVLAVELDDQAVVGPEHVGHVAADPHVRLWDLEGEGLAEEDEVALEAVRAAGELR